jgi:alpha-tubulin suppressor-like RCC1 family protein
VARLALNQRTLAPSAARPVHGRQLSISGNGQTLVRLSNGALWAWAANFHGQQGNSTIRKQASPIRFYPPAGVTYKRRATGSASSYAVSVTGQVYAWGVILAVQVGDGTTNTTRTPCWSPPAPP